MGLKLPGSALRSYNLAHAENRTLPILGGCAVRSADKQQCLPRAAYACPGPAYANASANRDAHAAASTNLAESRLLPAGHAGIGRG